MTGSSCCLTLLPLGIIAAPSWLERRGATQILWAARGLQLPVAQIRVWKQLAISKNNPSNYISVTVLAEVLIRFLHVKFCTDSQSLLLSYCAHGI